MASLPWVVEERFFKLIWGQKFSSRWLAGMPRNTQDATPLASWMNDLESASKDLGEDIGIGKDEGWGAVWNGGGELAISEKKPTPFPLPGIGKPVLSKDRTRTDHNSGNRGGNQDTG